MMVGNSRKHIDSIESLRGVAALSVLLYHLVMLIKVPLPSSLAFIASHFSLGVPLFYTISGFALAYGYADRLDGPEQIKRFYIRRLFRIAPLFYTMLCLWLLANWVIWNKAFSVHTIALNMSLLFGLVPGQHESIVWAGWSVGIEMLFYLIFPLLIVLIRTPGAALVVFVVACFLSAVALDKLTAAGLGSYAYMNLGTQLPFFVGGITVFRIWERIHFAQILSVGWVLLLAVGTLAIIVVGADHCYSALVYLNLKHNIWAVAFALLVLSACLVRNPVLESAALKSLGKLSFSIYLLHPIIMLGLTKLDFRLWVGQLTDEPMVNFLVASIITIGLVWGLSILSFGFVEGPGVKFGKRVTGRLK